LFAAIRMTPGAIIVHFLLAFMIFLVHNPKHARGFAGE
jgi:hypothetical protein